MPHSIPLGPFALPVEPVVLFAAVALGIGIAQRLNRRRADDIKPLLWRLVLLGAVVARVAFIYQYRAAYLESPLDIFDFGDGGWDPQSGIIAAWVYALSAIRKKPAVRKPLLAGLATASVAWAAVSITLAIGTAREATLSAVAVPTFDGRTAALLDFKGKPSVVNLWATWCPPCQRELPLLQQAQAAHPEVNFVFLNQGESAEKVRAFLALRGVSLRNVLLDLKGQAGAEFGGGALPTTLLFDGQGRLVGSHIGELSHGTLEQSLGRLGTAAARERQDGARPGS